MNPAVLLGNAFYRDLKRYVLDRTGLSYYADRDEDLASRISRRLVALGIMDAGAYLNVLQQKPEEVDCLIGELTIGETYFFRQPEHFELLRKTILPEILERKRPSQQIRIWSAGCATGAEPYSIAVLLRLEFERQIAGWDVSVLATDLNVEFLAQAREGLFGSWALRETPPEIRARCFREEGKRWRLLPEFRKRVTFQPHNLMSDAHPVADGVPFDLIICRNVLIYFSRETILAVAGRFFEHLGEGGWLLVGHAEPNPETFTMFEAVTGPAGTAYRKSSEPGFKLPTTAELLDLSGILNSRAEAPANSLPLSQHAAPAVPWLPPPLQPVPAAVVDARSTGLAVEGVRMLADRGNWDRARFAARQLVNREPLNASAQFTLGLILEHGGEHVAARESLRKAIYLDRGFALAHYHLGSLLQLSGEAQSASRAFATVLRLTKGMSPAEPLLHGDGITAQELGDLAKMHLEFMSK